MLLSVNNVTATHAELSWQAPENDGGTPISNYCVEKKASHSSRWARVNK